MLYMSHDHVVLALFANFSSSVVVGNFEEKRVFELSHNFISNSFNTTFMYVD